MNQIKAIVFDMDGVLIDAKEWHYEALNKSLELFGYKISRSEHLTTYDGLPTAKKLQFLSLERGLPRGLFRVIEELKQIYTMEFVHLKCKPLFEHQYALSHLKLMGYKLGVASNSIRMTIDLMMQKADLAKYLDFTLSNQDVSKPKPDPEIYLKAFDCLKLPPAETLIVEDNKNGIMAAKASGGHVLEVKDVYDVTYHSIINRIKEIEK